ncbi:asparaginase [Amnibacterium kyonggiense]|uniref:Asparaginase n=1 Tax=Amnibacterium kyonggiense TaxID=595671 RepID=A0A4R7FQN4_9MICO|nr:asparaginase [Amnibacterium kyonggiense]TDS79919.1 asparaginase [Amnibacterium kyonggiense]
MSPPSGSALDAARSVPLAVVERSGFPESQHIGAAVVVAPDGSVLAAHGDRDALVYPRSALKPFQTVAALRAGVELDAPGLVIVTASHHGEPRHIAAVRAVLERVGAGEEDLRTPSAWPSSRSAAADLVRAGLGPTRIAMNCSGNHAGMIGAALALGVPVESYLDPTNRVHALAAEVVHEYTGARPQHPGTDGCGGPVWAVPLVALARGYAALFSAHPALAAAIRADPVLIDGTGTPTTRAIGTLDVVAKIGAEGVWCAVAPDGTAVAVKALDGAERATAAVGVALLAAAGAIDGEAADAFLADRSLAVLGGGAEVGRLRVLV